MNFPPSTTFDPIKADGSTETEAAPNRPADRGKARPISEMYDAILRAENLTKAAEALAYDRTNLTDAGSPPVLALLDMVKDELAALSEDISELENVERKSTR